MQRNGGGIKESRKSRTECVNDLPGFLCSLTESFSYRYIMGWWLAVACKYRLINRCIAGVMYLLPRYINFYSMRVNSSRMLLCTALPQGRVSICHKDNQKVRCIMKPIIDDSRCGMANIWKWASTECQWSVNDFSLCIIGNLSSEWLQTSIDEILAAFMGKNNSNTLPTTFWNWASMECQQIMVFHIW